MASQARTTLFVGATFPYFPEVNDSGQPLHSLLAAEFGVPFVAGYVASYMLVSMGIFNVILAVYVDITMKALPFDTGGSQCNHTVIEHCNFYTLLGWLAEGYAFILFTTI